MINRRKFIGLSTIVLSSGSLVKKALANESGEVLKHNSAMEQTYTYPEFDLRKIPFSYIGSYQTIEKKEDAEYSRLVINTVRKSAIPYKWQSTWANNLLQITLFKDGVEMPFSTVAKPWALALQGKDASASIVFADADTLVIKTSNCALRLIPYRDFAWVYQLNDGSYMIYDNQPNQYYYVKGSANNHVQIGRGPNSESGIKNAIEFEQSGHNTIVLKIITNENHQPLKQYDLDSLLSRRKKEIETWMTKLPGAKAQHKAAVQTGWYLFWNLQVSPWKNYSRQSILSSKKSMDMLWSWDICFNALALVKADHALAWGQMFAVLDKQRENGLLPDTVSDLESGFGFNKPPIWGWTIMKMLKLTPASAWNKYLTEAYPKIVKFTQWWFTNRNLNKQGICAYMHGNDSGWDNSTIFDERLPVESPDLTAYLILQTEALSFIARHLGKHDEALKWDAVSKQQLALFKKTFITPEGLSYQTLGPQGVRKRVSTSLLTHVPLILGERLPATTRKAMIDELSKEGVFLTAYGLASEAINSPKYEPNGYWRGPVWAPSTYLIFDGLLACGEKQLAKTIAGRFCDMVSLKATFNENYNAITGEGQYDSGLTWTASDFLLMANWLAEND